jgi:hypothetical protein
MILTFEIEEAGLVALTAGLKSPPDILYIAHATTSKDIPKLSEI